MAATMPRAVRVPDDVWRAALAKAQAEGTTLTAVVVEALRRYAAE
jgi:predicted HicB family RNase H-like nuclease